MPPPPSFPTSNFGGGPTSTLFDPYQPRAGGPTYAGWWSRVAATLIDGFIAIPFMIPGLVFIGLSFAAGHDGTCTNFNSVEGVSRSCRQPNLGLLGLGVLAMVAAYVLYYVILCRMLGRTAQTWGRKAKII